MTTFAILRTLKIALIEYWSNRLSKKSLYITSKRQDIVVFSQLTIDWENNKYEEDMVKGSWQISSLTYEMLVCAYLCIRISRYCQALVQVPNPLSQQAPNPDPKVRPSLKNPKTQFFGLGLTQ